MRERIHAATLGVVLVALFPATAAFIYPPAFWGPKGVIAYVTGWALFLYVFRWVVGPRAVAWAERAQAAASASSSE